MLEYIWLELKNAASPGSVPFQIFATDISERLGLTRSGGPLLGTAVAEILRSACGDFSSARRGISITSPLREMCIFRPPKRRQGPALFQSDLITCRNLLIYLGAVLQSV